VAGLNHEPTRTAVTAERTFLRYLVTYQTTPQARQEVGCQVPMGAYGIVRDGQLMVEGMVATLDGRKVIRRKVIGSPAHAERAGQELAERILEAGGRDILDEM
jgi:hydroxymethylbilane synthase